MFFMLAKRPVAFPPIDRRGIWPCCEGWLTKGVLGVRYRWVMVGLEPLTAPSAYWARGQPVDDAPVAGPGTQSPLPHGRRYYAHWRPYREKYAASSRPAGRDRGQRAGIHGAGLHGAAVR